MTAPPVPPTRGGPWARALRVAAGLHREGVPFSATLETRGVPLLAVSPLFTAPCAYRAVVRFSRTLGRRPRDWLGLALKVPGAGARTDQDLLFVTSDWERHRPRRSTTCFGVPFSTVTPYSIGHRRVRLVAVAASAPGGDPDELEHVLERAPVVFRVLAHERSAGWVDAGRLVLGKRRPGDGRDLPYSPAHCGAGIVPAGVGNAVRAIVYATTQGARTGS